MSRLLPANPFKGVALSYPGQGAALVVGAGNIGAGVVRKLADAGMPIVFTYSSNEERARNLETEVRARGGTAVARQLNFLDGDTVDLLVDEVAYSYGRLHTVVYCAGPAIPLLRIRDTSPELLEAHLRADTLGCYRLFRASLPVLSLGGGGTLTACVTMANHRVIDTDGLSAIPKAAVEAIVRQIASEEAVNGIRANTIGIGWIGGFAASFEDARQYTAKMTGPEGRATQELIETLASMIRMGRPGTSDEVGDIVSYLASDQASYITGCMIPADGGAML